MSSYFSEAHKTRVAYLMGALLADSATLVNDADEERATNATTADRLAENLNRLRVILLPDLETTGRFEPDPAE